MRSYEVMHSGSCLCLALISTLAAAPLPGQTAQRVILQRVEPVYDASLTQWLSDPVRIEMIVDGQGKPFSLSSPTGLPDNVVQALSQWRFAPGEPASLALSLPLKRAPGRYLEATHRPSSLRHTHPDIAIPASKITPESAPSIEKKLDKKSNVTPDLIDQRVALLAWAAHANTTEAAALRARQVEWLVRNDPGAEALDSAQVLLASAAYEPVKRIWLDLLARDPNDAITLGHATWFLQFSDPQQVEDLLLPRIPRVSGAAGWLGELYAWASLGVTTLDPANSQPVGMGDRAPDAAFALHARSALSSSSDGRILLSAFTTITGAAPALKQVNALPAGFTELCRSLETRVKAFDPADTHSCEAAITQPAPGPSTVRPAQIRTQTPPQYPQDAKDRHITGSVHFNAIIGRDGKLRDLELLSAPLVFYPASRSAVLHWEYKPTVVNGNPADVSTQIDVNYTLYTSRP